MDENRSASLENEPLGDEEQTRKDMSYSPASERETAEKQADSEGSDEVLPGTGGPDDSGDVDVPPEDLRMP
jgi:hypothetical protein